MVDTLNTIRKKRIDFVDLWRADTEARIISRQTDDFSFSVPVYESTAYVLLTFDENNGDKRWTAETFNNYLRNYLDTRNKTENIPFLINYYQLVGLADADNIIGYKPSILDSTKGAIGTESNPDFFATVGGQYRVSFEQKPGVTLPKLPQGIIDLFECNQRSSRVARHKQQPYKKYSVSVVDDGFVTNYLAIVAINTVIQEEIDGEIAYTPVTVDTGNYNITDYFAFNEEGCIFTSIQNLGYLIKDIEAIRDFLQYYNISLLGNNKLTLQKTNG